MQAAMPGSHVDLADVHVHMFGATHLIMTNNGAIQCLRYIGSLGDGIAQTIPAQTLMPPCAAPLVSPHGFGHAAMRGNNIWELGFGVAKLKPHIAGT